MDYLHETDAELGIDLDKPLSEQDPLNKLNDLAKKKKKNADTIHDYFKANKRLKSLVQYEDHPAGTVLNEPILDKSTWEDLILYHEGPSDVKDFQEYLNDLEEEFQKRALLTKSNIFFKNGSQRFSGAKATDET
ncbi:hypothetical protein Tco_1016607 [Tanacetum coccineum]|uniref:Uncharacterized protein n=1 Tax=Tanacetum coccineum TaxID=301880 RepID=A0ABQ5FR25_9ASTR